MFNQTQIEVELPGEAYPGLEVETSGIISIVSPDLDKEHSSGRIITAFLDWQPLLDLLEEQPLLLEQPPFFEAISERGSFESLPTLAPETALGEHILTIIVKEDNESCSAGVLINRTLLVTKMTPEIEIQAPGFTFLPRTIHIEGKIKSDLPLQEAQVTLEMGRASAIATAGEDGKFEKDLSLPFQLNVMGSQKLEVTTEPLEPWHFPAYTEVDIFVINPTNIGLISIAFISIGMVLYSRRRRGGVAILEAPPLPEVREIVLPPQPEVELVGIQDRVIKAYMESVRFIEKMTGIALRSQETLREFLGEAISKIGRRREAFSKLTELAERTLYSPHPTQPEEAAKAEELTRKIKEALRGKV